MPANVLEVNNPAVIPVIHYHDDYQALLSAEQAAQAGADGVFLIDHEVRSNPHTVFQVQRLMKEEFPALWSGVNSLSLSALEAFRLVTSGEYPVDGIWADNAGIVSGVVDVDQDLPNQVRRLRRDNCLTDVQYFGGVAHKATPSHTEDSQTASELAFAAMPFVDVVTTSGPGTGQAPNPEKIKAMQRRLMGRIPLAVASGISIENVDLYAEHADAFLVASSIEAEDGNFDELALKALVRRVRQLAEQ